MSNLDKVEQDFNKKVTDLALTAAKENNIIAPSEIDQLMAQLHKDFKVDTQNLSNVASRLIEKNEKLSDTEVAISLLKEVAANGENKFMKKIASKMLNDKWWEK
ncbi:hypothetical protein ACSU6B_21160 [Neobacillus sp. C211]|uniref:hypothetical protein n=1 Tax=unclassified Neobacillus TaxID=2675272 RepID=UPI00397A4374